MKNLLPNIDKKARKSPIAFSYPNKVDYYAIVHFPSQWSLSGDKWKLDRKAYSCDFESFYTESDSTFTQHFTFESKQDNIEVAQTTEYLADFDKIVESSGSEYSWNQDLDTELRDSGINWLALFSYVLLIGGTLIFLFKKVYPKNATPEDEYPYAADPINGWLVLPLIGLCLNPFLIIIDLLSGDGSFFSQKTWISMDYLNGMIHGKVLLSVELMLNSIFIANIIFVLVLFFKQRDTLPKAIIWLYYGFHIFTLIFDLILVELAGSNIEESSIVDLIKSVVSGAIWIPYFNISERVKRTFVNRYNA